jgi:DNA-binding XRE family transcriptional regulator
MMDLREFRIALGLRQREAAKGFGIAKETMSRFETGEKPLPLYVQRIMELATRSELTRRQFLAWCRPIKNGG